jgi:nucleoside 2-deoxyribosyltransferase
MPENKECFLIAPLDANGSSIREQTNHLETYIITEAVEEFDYSITRSDKMDQPGSITNQIIEKIVESDLVIADLSGQNPNVFYELAVRHATGKPYIQLIDDSADIPFDVSDIRTIQYGLEVAEADETVDEIQSMLEEIEELEEPDEEGDGENIFENPISQSARFRSIWDSQEPIDEDFAEVLQIVSSLDNRIEKMEGEIEEMKLQGGTISANTGVASGVVSDIVNQDTSGSGPVFISPEEFIEDSEKAED